MPFPYTNKSSNIPEARKRYSFRADPSRIGTIASAPRGRGAGRGCAPTIQLFYVENTLTQSLMFSSKAGCSKSISSTMFAME